MGRDLPMGMKEHHYSMRAFSCHSYVVQRGFPLLPSGLKMSCEESGIILVLLAGSSEVRREMQGNPLQTRLSRTVLCAQP